MEDQQAKAEPFVNGDPAFGSSLLTDDFGRRSTDEDMTARLEATAERIQQDIPRVDEREEELTTAPLLQNPDGATQVFSDMHGMTGDVESVADLEAAPAITGTRHLAGLTIGVERLGNTDWGAGTDGGRSGKPQDGIPYGFFSGV